MLPPIVPSNAAYLTGQTIDVDGGLLTA